MQSPELQYLEQVLGIRQFVRPAGVAELAVCVLSSRELTEEERLLLQKMLASVQITDFSLSTSIQDIPAASGYVTLGDVAISVSAPHIRIEQFEKFVQNANAPEMRNLKKQIWEELKLFKKNLET